jgi:hypothetical protein
MAIGHRRRFRLSRATWIVSLLVAGPLLLPLIHVTAVCWSKIHLLDLMWPLLFICLVTFAVALPVEWLCRGGRFSLLSLMVGVVVAAFLMWLNLEPSANQNRGWPFAVAGPGADLPVVVNIAVCLLIVVFCGVASEISLRGLERMRQEYSKRSDEPSWRSFARTMRDERDRERKDKIKPGADGDQQPPPTPMA